MFCLSSATKFDQFRVPIIIIHLLGQVPDSRDRFRGRVESVRSESTQD
jgi:hypothetical protein